MLFNGEDFILQMHRFFHSHSLEGFSGGKQRRCAWICSLGRSGSVLGWLILG
jgi:hypothetical protein